MAAIQESHPMRAITGEEKEYLSIEFENLKMSHEIIDSASFEECSFTNCDFSEAEFTGCEFTDCLESLEIELVD